MSDTALVRLGRSIVATGWLCSVAGLVIAADSGHFGFWWRSYAPVNALVACSFGFFAWKSLWHQPRNGAVWSMVAAAAFGVGAGGLGLVSVLFDGTPDVMLDEGWVPAQSPSAVGWTLVIARGLAAVGLFTPLTLGLLMFPDGHIRSRWSRFVALASVISIAFFAVAYAWWHRPSNAAPEGPALGWAMITSILCVMAAATGLVARFRTSTGTARQQFKWIAWGSTVGVMVFSTYAFLPDSVVNSDLAVLVAMIGAASWVASYGVAVGRHRLYEIDLVISRTVLYVSLALLISASYVLVVVGVGSTIGGSSLWLSVLATALIAVAFEPARTRIQVLANRVVYGRRATPHAVLGDLAARLGFSERPEHLLSLLADQLRSGTGARRTIVWTVDNGAITPMAVSSSSNDQPDPVEAESMLPGTAVPIDHEGQTARLSHDRIPAREESSASRHLPCGGSRRMGRSGHPQGRARARTSGQGRRDRAIS